jgi:hypothetical protein
VFPLIGAYRQPDGAAKFARLVRLIDREPTNYISLVLTKDCMKQYIVAFAHRTGPLSLILAGVRASSKKSAIRIVHDGLLEIVSEKFIPEVTECSADIDEAAASLCRAFRAVTDDDQEK